MNELTSERKEALWGFFFMFYIKYLRMSKKSSTFAAELRHHKLHANKNAKKMKNRPFERFFSI